MAGGAASRDGFESRGPASPFPSVSGKSIYAAADAAISPPLGPAGAGGQRSG